MYQGGAELLLSGRMSVSREVTMFDHNCTDCGKRQLIFPSQITAMNNTGHGIVVEFRCWCGADQTMVSGRAATERPAAHLAA